MGKLFLNTLQSKNLFANLTFSEQIIQSNYDNIDVDDDNKNTPNTKDYNNDIEHEINITKH